MKLAVIILNWNGKSDTLACLAALQKTKTPVHETVVIDNGSDDDSTLAIEALFPEVTLLKTGKNLGYAGGNNVGIEYLLQKNETAFFLLLNNDTLIDPYCITAFLKTACRSKKIGIVGGYPLLFSDPLRLDHLGGIWNDTTASFDLIGRGARRGFTTDLSLDYVCGCSILIKREVFRVVPRLEPSFFLFWEEADFCMRAKEAGFDLAVSYEAVLLHKVSASFIGGSPHKTYFWWRGRCLFIHRRCSFQKKKRIYKTVLVREFLHLLKLRWIKTIEFYLLKLFTKKNLNQKKKKILEYKAALHGFRDYRRSRFGEGPSWLLFIPK